MTNADEAAAISLKVEWQREAARRQLLGLAPLTQSVVADIMDIGQSAVSQYLNGKIPLNYKAVMAFANAIGIDPERIRSDLPEQALSGARHRGSADNWADVPAYAQAAAAGDGSVAEEYAEASSLKFKRSSLTKKGLFQKKLSVFYASGDSMEPRIQDGDALMFDQSDTKPKDGSIFIVQYDGELCVKRLQMFGEHWFLTSDNGTDPRWRKPIPVILGDDAIIVGRVRWIGSWED